MITELEATAYHVLKDFDAAGAAYRRWLRMAPPDHPDRKKMAVGLSKSLKKIALVFPTGDPFF